jgi:hydrogenase maturation protein HypF
MVLRRARGRVPGTLPLPAGFPDAQVLATGGQMKGAIALAKGGQVLLGHHLGDLDDALCAAEFDRAVADYRALFDTRPVAVAHDLHPAYRATQAAQAMARAEGMRLFPVQHHHAHLAACLAENLWPLDAAPVAGIILDGTGLGADGTVWGGEVLLGTYASFTRIAHLRPAPLAGGDRAAREPWRNALARLDQAGLADLADRLFPDAPLRALRAAIAAGVNAPPSSSAGRLYDAVAACLGLCPLSQGYEGEAAMRLEARAAAGEAPYPFGPELDPAPMLRALAADLAAGTDPARIAGRFQEGLAEAFAAPARALVAEGRAAAVALSGGCFQNATLQAAVIHRLGDVPVLTHRTTPANDGGLALGQLAVALARLADGAQAGRG